jgi:N-acetylneuraminic acid mutarotase
MGVAKSKDGKLYVIGGGNARGPLDSVEMLDPAASSPQWTLLPAHLHTPRYALAATVGSDGKIYAIGGIGNDFTILDTVEVYDPADASPHWTTLHAQLYSPRKGLAAVTGLDGKIYAIGGAGKYGLLDTVEVYDPTATLPRWTRLPITLVSGRQNFAAVVGPDGKIYAIGGCGARGKPLDSIEALDAGANQWSLLPNTLPETRYGHAAVVGPDGNIYVLGGRIGVTAPLRKKPADAVNDPLPPAPRDQLAFFNSGSVPTGRTRFDRPLLAAASLDTAACFNPTAHDPAWQRLQPRLGTPRERLGAVVDPDGKIWVIGGVDLTILPLNSSEIYDPKSSQETKASHTPPSP